VGTSSVLGLEVGKVRGHRERAPRMVRERHKVLDLVIRTGADLDQAGHGADSPGRADRADPVEEVGEESCSLAGLDADEAIHMAAVQ
jgi:hypothetical protein